MNGHATQKLPAACLILAGGQGNRLSPDKPLLEIDGRPIIQHTADIVVPLFEQVLLVTNTPEKFAFLGLPLVADERPGCGPLMGIYSGLRKTDRSAAFVCAADMPFLDATLIWSQYRELDDFDIVVPCPAGRPEFLHAFYRQRCVPAIRENLAAGTLKIEMLAPRCSTRYLGEKWFAQNGLTGRLDRAFANINTPRDYRRWSAGKEAEPTPTGGLTSPPHGHPRVCHGPTAIDPAIIEAIRRTLIEQESTYQTRPEERAFSSIWAHSFRVSRIAHHIAGSEGWDPEPALLAGLLHDCGKFAHGSYHASEAPEEEHAVRIARQILMGTAYEKWLPMIADAILSTFLEGEATNEVGRAVYDADCLDKLGNMGIVQFFVKKALRQRFLDNDLLIRFSTELTYAHHAPDTLTTATGRALARNRAARTRRFFKELLEEWTEIGLGTFTIVAEEIAGIACHLVVPVACACGGRLAVESDIIDSLKCRSAVMTYRCPACGFADEFSFCLPKVKGLPPKR